MRASREQVEPERCQVGRDYTSTQRNSGQWAYSHRRRPTGSVIRKARWSRFTGAGLS